MRKLYCLCLAMLAAAFCAVFLASAASADDFNIALRRAEKMYVADYKSNKLTEEEAGKLRKSSADDIKSVMRLAGDSFAKEDYKTSFMLFTLAARSTNDTQAVFMRGVSFLNGRGTDVDKNAGIEAIAAAAKQGHPVALYLLGLAYKEGVAVEISPRDSKYCLEKAAQAGVNEETLCFQAKYDTAMNRFYTPAATADAVNAQTKSSAHSASGAQPFQSSKIKLGVLPNMQITKGKHVYLPTDLLPGEEFFLLKGPSIFSKSAYGIQQEAIYTVLGVQPAKANEYISLCRYRLKQEKVGDVVLSAVLFYNKYSYADVKKINDDKYVSIVPFLSTSESDETDVNYSSYTNKRILTKKDLFKDFRKINYWYKIEVKQGNNKYIGYFPDCIIFASKIQMGPLVYDTSAKNPYAAEFLSKYPPLYFDIQNTLDAFTNVFTGLTYYYAEHESLNDRRYNATFLYDPQSPRMKAIKNKLAKEIKNNSTAASWAYSLFTNYEQCAADTFRCALSMRMTTDNLYKQYEFSSRYITIYIKPDMKLVVTDIE